ncbi:MAG: prephenate dehydrogenase/arogenate dehydrogenase family protein [Thaumarchaeota archaeon]|nr:prephenate dehydrogenase/arogenate dehydrogenase family protein [Candidatus Calditenuaceae archaeon]MDW8186665.1 prephenate dehydrogenase/arogenate dehydrogenase family protein [Nitrososphaerota archaeon]
MLIGCGQMGSWFARRLSSQGHSLLLFDRRPEAVEGLSKEVNGEVLKGLEAVDGVDVVMLAVPVIEAKKALRELMRAGVRYAGVVDVSALKGPLMDAARAIRAKGITVALIHPLFGPKTENIEGTYTAHVEPGDLDREEELIRSLLPGTTLLRMGWREHDKASALSVSLTHYLGLALAEVMAGSSRTLPTNSMRVAVRLAEISLQESSSFYDDLVMCSGTAMAALRRYVRVCEEVLNAAEERRLGRLHSRLKRRWQSRPEESAVVR